MKLGKILGSISPLYGLASGQGLFGNMGGLGMLGGVGLLGSLMGKGGGGQGGMDDEGFSTEPGYTSGDGLVNIKNLSPSDALSGMRSVVDFRHMYGPDTQVPNINFGGRVVSGKLPGGEMPSRPQGGGMTEGVMGFDPISRGQNPMVPQGQMPQGQMPHRFGRFGNDIYMGGRHPFGQNFLGRLFQ